MRQQCSVGSGVAILAAVATVIIAYSACADDAIGPMAGVGGVVREAENRVLAPNAEPSKKAVAIAPVTAGNTTGASKASLMNGRQIGEIESVAILGSADFAEREGVGKSILEELGGPGVRTEGEVAAAVAKVQKDLMEQGYYLVRILPYRSGSYDAQTKTLFLVMDEGRFGTLSLSFDGEKDDGFWFSRGQIISRFDKIREGDTFDYRRLRSALFEANSHPDLTIDTSISVRKPIEGVGADRRVVRYADIDLEVRESCPLHMVWEVNNYGMEEVEEWQTSLTAQYLNLTKHDDVLTFSPSMSFGGELFSLAGSYMLPHHWLRGGATTLYGGYSKLDVDDIVPRLDLEGSGYFVGLQHTENLYDDDKHLLAFSLGVMWRYIEDQYSAYSMKLRKRSATILPLSAALSYTGKKPDFMGGRNFATVQAVYNLMNGDDKLEEMWTDAEEHYWLFRWQLARLQPLFGWHDEATNQDLHQWMLFLKMEGQYTSDTLIPVEKLSLGGYNCLRGYHARGYLGDYGVYGTVELRTPILVDTFASMFGDRTNKSAFDRLQFLGFVDWGYTAFNDLPSGYDDNEFIYSTGLGARLSVTKYTQLKCDIAFPLHDTDWADDDSMEVYLSMQVQF